MKCKKCDSEHIHKRGFSPDGKQRVKCMDCGKWGSYYNKGGANILLFDIETTPLEVYVWGLIGNKYIQPNNIIKDWNVLSWSAKWLFDSRVMSDVQTPKEAIERDDERIIKSIWSLIDQADIIIAHNGDKFDVKKLNTRFHMNGLYPPSPYRSIDTLKVVKKSFAFSSNKLDYLSQIMTNRNKLETNFKLWTDCLHGNRNALNKMLAYNEEDVRLLEEVYVELRPWIRPHPNVNIYDDIEGCPSCGSDDLEPNGGYYTTVTNKYLSYSCNECGSLSRRIESELSADDRQTLMRSIPK